MDTNERENEMTAATIEKALNDLYMAGHATFYGRRAVHPADCVGCVEATRQADLWDEYWRAFEARRLAHA